MLGFKSSSNFCDIGWIFLSCEKSKIGAYCLKLEYNRKEVLFEVT